MSKKNNSSQKNTSKKSSRTSAPVKQPPKWGIVVAGFFAFLIVSVALIVMQKLGIESQWVRTGIVLVLAVAAGIGARPLTLALQKRFNSND